MEDAHPTAKPQSATYATVLEQVDHELAFWDARAQRDPRGWTAAQRLAEIAMRRAKLSGDLRDYTRAKEALALAFDNAPEGAGPFLARARLAFTLHRLADVEPDLRAEEARILLDDRTQAAILGLRADVAFHRGDYMAALAGYNRALRVHESLDGFCRLAHYHWKTGAFERAESTYGSAENLLVGETPMLRAWFDLQRGLLDLDRGRWREALLHYRDADTHLAGWWLIEEHVAEIHALLDHKSLAREMYEDLVARTGNPEFMSALADLSEGEERRRWMQRAEHEYAARLSIFPEATLGHVLEHAIETGDERAVPWAQENHRLRPGGEASVLLARAYQAAGAWERARAVIERVLATPYATAELHATAAEVFARTGAP